MNGDVARSGPSPISRFLVLTVVVIGLLVGFRWLVTPDTSRRHLEFFPDMATSPAVESQSLAAILPFGLSQQALPDGVVARGALPFPYGPDAEEAARAGRELRSPMSVESETDMQRGADVYRIHCSTCHDATGAGLGPAVMRGMLQPTSMLSAASKQVPDGTLFHLLTKGRGNMPAMAARIDVDDRWRAILHVRRLQAEAP